MRKSSVVPRAALAAALAATMWSGWGAARSEGEATEAPGTRASVRAAETSGTVQSDEATTNAAVRRLVERYGDRLRRSRYMERGEGEPVTVPGWEGFPTRLYRYTVTDPTSGTVKQASVVLLDAPAERIARWVVTACSEARGGQIRADDTDRLFQHVLSQSGGQFPVTGVVYEDILPADGLYETYCFRDGVTVVVEGVPHRGTAPLDAAQTSASLWGKVTKVYRYARIQGSSPGEYRAAGGPVDVGTNDARKPAWLDVVRQSYQAAWQSDRYSLMSDWARANLK